MKVKFDFLIYSFFLFTLLIGGRLFIPLVIIFGLIYIYKKLIYSKKLFKFDSILLSFFALFYPIQALLDPKINLSNLDIVEWKVYLVIIILALIALEENNVRDKSIYKKLDFKLGNPLIVALLTFAIVCIIQVPTRLDTIYRFADGAPAAARIISTYFGFVCLFSFSLVSNKYLKILSLFLALLGGGGSVTLSIFVYLTTYFLYLKNITIRRKIIISSISLLLSTLILLPVFLLSQNYRGRSIANFQNIDRYIIFTYAFKYIDDNFNDIDYIFGKGPDSNVELRDLMEQYSLTTREIQMGKYLLTESETVSGKNFHNDFLRVFAHFGIFGVFMFLRYSFILFSYDIPLYLSILTLSLFNSIITTTFCFAFIIIVFTYKNLNLRFKKKSI
tara:strand:+ start:4169 stop:5335 length:1167 start_codon:yes stop_codon:yes gene_type:complete